MELYRRVIEDEFMLGSKKLERLYDYAFNMVMNEAVYSTSKFTDEEVKELKSSMKYIADEAKRLEGILYPSV